jgi:hypothetical protein
MRIPARKAPKILRKRYQLAIVLIIGVAAIGGMFVYVLQLGSLSFNVWETSGNPSDFNPPVMAEGFSICAQNCGYPAPYINGVLQINYS